MLSFYHYKDGLLPTTAYRNVHSYIKDFKIKKKWPVIKYKVFCKFLSCVIVQGMLTKVLAYTAMCSRIFMLTCKETNAELKFLFVLFLGELRVCSNLSNALHNPDSLFVGAAGAESSNRRDSGPDDTGIVAANCIF